MRALLLTVLVAIVCAACEQGDGGPQRGDADSVRAPAPALGEVRIGYFANLTHAQAVLGVASGEFAQAVAPTRVSTQVFNAGPSLIEALFADQIDLGYVGPGPAINAYAKTRGEGIRVISGAASNGVVVVARPGSGIERFEDLKGRRIATPQLGNTQDISARHFLMAKLGQTDTDNVIPINNAEQSSMMSRGQIDAAWAPEPWGARLVAEVGGTIVAEEKDLWPGGEFVLTTIVTTPKFLAGHPDVVRKLLAAHAAWTERLQRDSQRHVPDLAAALTTLTGKRVPPSLISAAIGRVRFTNDPSPSTLAAISRWMYDLKYVKSPPPTDGLVDTTILRSIASTRAPAAAPAPAPAAPAATMQ